MNENEQELIARLVQKLSEYSGLSVDVLNERLEKRKLDAEAAITLLDDQIFCYECDPDEFFSGNWKEKVTFFPPLPKLPKRRMKKYLRTTTTGRSRKGIAKVSRQSTGKSSPAGSNTPALA